MHLLGLIQVPTWLLVLLILLATAYIYYTWHFGAFDGYGLPGPKPYPVLGTTGASFTKGILQMDVDIMKKYGKIVAMFMVRTPTIFTSDEDLIKEVCVKQIASFTDRQALGTDEGDMQSMLAFSQGDQWRRLRHLMSPTFSSGKLRKMNHQVNRCAKIFTDHMKEYARTGKALDIKTVSQAFSMDTIAATAFGLEINSQDDPDNPFVTMGKKAFDVNIVDPKIILIFFCPFLIPLLNWLNIGFFDKDMIRFFSNLTDQAITQRQKSDKKEVDFLQLLLNAENDLETENDVTDDASNNGFHDVKPERKGLTRQELKAQAILFFVAGFETTAGTIAYLSYNLTVYPEKQEKLYQEIKKHMQGKETVEYNTLSEMPYLDQCINESLRLYPPGPRIDRVCTKDVTVKGIHIKKGWQITLPAYAIHRDPELWKDPEEFIPERFEDMSQIGYKFMPFGVGSRNCLGMRLALMEVKILMIHFLNSYKLIKSQETVFPLKMDPNRMIQPLKPIKIGLQKRA